MPEIAISWFTCHISHDRLISMISRLPVRLKKQTPIVPQIQRRSARVQDVCRERAAKLPMIQLALVRRKNPGVSFFFF